ncbi:hypothetical protein ACGFX4_30570 [Kitasatospora sp. NPDC048365]|uniref:hypothetical protein n=1 Tax=Kitasatospora sp. NPDC048365 TaxID=3364050 RepID=UPI0037247E62
MTAPHRTYRYVGPADVRAATVGAPAGTQLRTAEDLANWLVRLPAGELAEPFTYVVDPAGVLRLAPRRSEHVACAAGQRVLAAGEIGFGRVGGRWVVEQVSNQSTGYCPDVVSWPAVARALDRVGIDRPEGFTHAVVFRRCTACGECSVVRDGHFVCVFCDAKLPPGWNVDPG